MLEKIPEDEDWFLILRAANDLILELMMQLDEGVDMRGEYTEKIEQMKKAMEARREYFRSIDEL